MMSLLVWYHASSGGVSIQGCLHPGDVSIQGVSIQGFSIQRVSIQGFSIQRVCVMKF